MKRERLKMYNIDIKYMRDLSNVDDKVLSVSPQLHKENRPFVGIVVICDNKKYCIPLSSPKPKHEKMKNEKDFSKIYNKNDKLIGVLNFNSMIPVNDVVINEIDLHIRPNDSQRDKYYKGLLNDQLDWCNDNQALIETKANKLYFLVTQMPDKMKNLTRRCCDFKKLEAVLEKWEKSHGIDNTIQKIKNWSDKAIAKADERQAAEFEKNKNNGAK